MGREELIRAIMAQEGIDYATASQRASQIHNLPNAQDIVSRYEEFSRFNPDLMQGVDMNYSQQQAPQNMMSSQGYPQAFGNQLNLSGQGNIGTDPLQMRMNMNNQNVSTPDYQRMYSEPWEVDTLPVRQPTQQITPQNPVQNTLVDTPLSKQVPPNREGFYDNFNPFMYPGGLSAGYQAYTAGRLLSRENKTAGDWIGGLSAAVGGGMNIGRSVMSGIANTKQTDKARDWWMEQEMKRQYTPNRTYGDQNNRGEVTSSKYGGTINIKRNGN